MCNVQCPAPVCSTYVHRIASVLPYKCDNIRFFVYFNVFMIGRRCSMDTNCGA